MNMIKGNVMYQMYDIFANVFTLFVQLWNHYAKVYPRFDDMENPDESLSLPGYAGAGWFLDRGCPLGKKNIHVGSMGLVP